jgi:hypothetical protein
MPNLYALQGVSSIGKTETIRTIYDLLVLKYPNATVTDLQPRRRKDVAVVLDSCKGMKVGIESQGDPNSGLKASLQNFIGVKCDVIFCATRTGGMTVSWVNACAAAGYQIDYVPQTVVPANHNHALTNSYGFASGVGCVRL